MCCLLETGLVRRGSVHQARRALGRRRTKQHLHHPAHRQFHVSLLLSESETVELLHLLLYYLTPLHHHHRRPASLLPSLLAVLTQAASMPSALCCSRNAKSYEPYVMAIFTVAYKNAASPSLWIKPSVLSLPVPASPLRFTATLLIKTATLIVHFLIVLHFLPARVLGFLAGLFWQTNGFTMPLSLPPSLSLSPLFSHCNTSTLWLGSVSGSYERLWFSFYHWLN